MIAPHSPLRVWPASAVPTASDSAVAPCGADQVRRAGAAGFRATVLLDADFFAERFGAGLIVSRAMDGWKRCFGAAAGISPDAVEPAANIITNATRRTAPSRGENEFIISEQRGNNETAIRL